MTYIILYIEILFNLILLNINLYGRYLNVLFIIIGIIFIIYGIYNIKK
ncbi:hypothetical protein [Candidatus Karelsulcia muelleri]|nr:hypothetical protein [Candidatus Karelsulcia muelleri]